MLYILQSKSGQRGKGGLGCIRYEPRVEREGNGWEGKKLEREAACWRASNECKGHREHAQKRLGLQQWRLLAVVCACVLFAGACLCAYASACVCALLTAL